MNIQTLLNNLDVNPALFCEGDLQVYSPVEQQLIGTVKKHTEEQVDRCIELSVEAFKHWRLVPAPKRGELLRIFGNKLRKYKQSLGALVTLECGKILQEGLILKKRIQIIQLVILTEQILVQEPIPVIMKKI